MWRKLLVWGIRALVASGLVDKAKSKLVGWLKSKLAGSAAKAELKLQAELEKLEKATGIKLDWEDIPEELRKKLEARAAQAVESLGSEVEGMTYQEQR